MQQREYKTKEQVLARAQQAVGIPLGEIDKTGRIASGKGAIGTVLEESWFGYSINSESRPDFPEAGVELKATPYVFTKKGELRAKERLVCNIINYSTEHECTFETSSFWRKSKLLLLMPYQHHKDKPKSDFTIDAAILFGFPEEDRIIIQKDWETIVGKIKAGKAHEISEGDTYYLGACTKGATAKNVREQPFSSIPAKQRAFSLKQSYMTTILASYVFGSKVSQHVVKDVAELRNLGIEQYIYTRVQPWFGKTQAQLAEEFGLRTTAKNSNELLLARMLGAQGRISATEEFKKANIVPKTVRIRHDGRIVESMSFPTMDFKALVQEQWEDSTLHNYLAQTKFMFVLFKQSASGEYIFSDILFWNMPEHDLESVREVWQRTVDTIKAGVELTPKGNKIFNNLPKASQHPIAHVRPHAKNASDVLELPDGRYMTKQCFWLNNTYIMQQVGKTMPPTPGSRQ